MQQTSIFAVTLLFPFSIAFTEPRFLFLGSGAILLFASLPRPLVRLRLSILLPLDVLLELLLAEAAAVDDEFLLKRGLSFFFSFFFFFSLLRSLLLSSLLLLLLLVSSSVEDVSVVEEDETVLPLTDDTLLELLSLLLSLLSSPICLSLSLFMSPHAPLLCVDD